ncbi:NADH-ubiquinone oxidoreductase [Cutibacterium acnes JCM 18920]|nr:NADH-ubiquinone oxidoreductase [Cutibacterium acnes JCM 18920]
MIFLRLRKAWRRHKAAITVVGTHLSNGSAKMGAELARCLPGQEPEALAQLVADGTIGEGTIVLVGERAATRPGTLSAINDLDSTVRVAWVPRRAGEMGAIEAGLLPQLLPGGRLVDDAKARVDIAAAWGVTNLPTSLALTPPECWLLLRPESSTRWSFLVSSWLICLTRLELARPSRIAGSSFLSNSGSLRSQPEPTLFCRSACWRKPPVLSSTGSIALAVSGWSISSPRPL